MKKGDNFLSKEKMYEPDATTSGKFWALLSDSSIGITSSSPTIPVPNIHDRSTSDSSDIFRPFQPILNLTTLTLRLQRFLISENLIVAELSVD